MRRLAGLIGLGLVLMGTVGSVASQGQNLIVNGSMEEGFSQRDNVTGVPLGWAFYLLAGRADADRQEFAPYAYSAPTFWAMRSNYTTFVAGGRQTVSVVPNTTYRMVAYAFIWTCNDNVYSCIRDDGTRFSNQESGARVRIGLDPTGAIDPNLPSVIWGPWVQPWDGYQGLSLDALAQTGSMTVYLQADSGQAMAFNEVYWDEISLVPLTATALPPANSGLPVAPAAPPPAAPFVDTGTGLVQAQPVRPDGSVIHVVRQGDTLSGILGVYGQLYGVTKETVYPLNGWRYDPDFIKIGQEIIILPAGSLDPVTGQRVGGSAPPAAAPPPANPAEVVPTAPPAPTQIGVLPLDPASLRRVTAAEISALAPVEGIPPFLPE